MQRKIFFKRVAEDYFNESSCDFEQLKYMLKGITPIFGELTSKIEEEEFGERVITFIDRDVATCVIGSEEHGLHENEMDMSTVALKIRINKDNKVVIVEHGCLILTPANKEEILFLGSLIGKTIENID